LRTCLRQEVGFSIGTHWSKSKMITTYTEVKEGVAYPEPVFNRAIGIMAATYEPRLRLMEWRSGASVTLDVPLTFSLSVVDLLTGSRKHFSAEPLTQAELQSGIFAKNRGGVLGGFHTEVGSLLSVNVGQGATIENTSQAGLSLGIGYNFLYGPLMLNPFQNQERKDYKGYLGWVVPVGRIGLHIDKVVIYYAFSVAPVRVNYQTGYTFGPQTEWTNTYNRISASFRLGR
jgi:hypothetical protein